MALSPAKSHQPLHNFSLSFLKWGQTNHVNTSNRCRRLISDTTTTGHRRLSPRTDSRDSSDSDRNNHNKPPCSLNRMKKNGQRKVDDEDDGVLLERGTNNGKLSDADVVASAAVDGEVKPWNLRPRRSAISAIPNHMETGSDVVPTASNLKSRRLLRGAVAEESEAEEKKKKPKLWISLSKEEIEEDLYALTRSKPARRPKKRNKIIQRQIDNLFPGQYLIGISADSYRI